MGILLIVAGVILGTLAARTHRTIETQRPVVFQGAIGGLILIAITLGGPGLIVFGLIIMFS